MRVPVYPGDLVPDHGFKHIAKKLLRKWVGPEPIKLSFAREILSHSLGYRDYHDVCQSSKTCPPDAPTPSTSEVKANLVRVVTDILAQDGNKAIDLLSVEFLAASLPLDSLTALRGYPSVLKRDDAARAPDRALELEQAHAGLEVAKPRKQAAAFRGRGHDRAASEWKKSPPHPFYRQVYKKPELKSIESVVMQSGNLRDQALLAFMFSGVRSAEFLDTKVSQLSWNALSKIEHSDVDSTGGLIHIQINPKKRQLNQPLATRIIPITSASLILRYIQAGGLSGDDYLFPSSTNRKRAMTSRSLSLICETWAVKAKLKSRPFNANGIRHSLISHALGAARIDVLSTMGHLCTSTTLAYASEYTE